MKTKVPIVIVFLLIFISILTSVNAIPSEDLPYTELGQYAITPDGKHAYINNDKAFIMAPTEIHGSGWTYLNFTAKQFTGDIDLALGFDTTHLKPKRAEFYKPHFDNYTQDHTIYNVTGVFYERSAEVLDIGNEYNFYNGKQWVVEYYQPNYNYSKCYPGFENNCIPDNYTTETLVIAFDSILPSPPIIEGNNYTITYHNKRITDWLDITDRFSVLPESIHNNYDGKNKWYYVKEQPIVAGTEYQIRIYVDAPPQLGEHTYKYDVVMEPSGQSFAPANSNGNLFILDPYWNTSWSWRTFITYNQSAINGTHTNIPLQFYFNLDGLKDNGADIRLTYENGTGMPREIEFYNSTSNNGSLFLLANTSDTGFWLYGGNPSATEPAADSAYGSEPVWNSEVENAYIMGGDANDSTSNDRHLTEIGTITYPELDYGIVAYADWTNSNKMGGINKGASPGAGNYQITIRFKKDGAPSADYDPCIVAIGTGLNMFKAVIEPTTGTAKIVARGAGVYSEYDSTVDIGDDAWHTVVYRRNSTEHAVIIDGTKYFATLTARDITADNIYVGIQDNPSYDYINSAYIGMILIESTARSDNYESTRHNNLNNPTAAGTAVFYSSVGEIQYYVDSLHYNVTAPYNHTIESDGTITANRTISASDDTNWTAYSTENTSWVFTTAVTPAGYTNFTLYGDNLDNFTATNLTAFTQYNLINSSGTVEQQTTDGDGVATYDVNLFAGDYWIEKEAVVTEYIPPNPTSFANTTGNFWVNYTWSAGVGNVTDSYNISQNGTWVNGSLTAYNNSSVGAHGYSNIIVYAYNNSGIGTLSASSITDNVTVPNNAITISNVSASYMLNEGETLYIDANYADDDGDTPTFGDNSSDWNVDTATGVVSWVPADGEDGTYNWYINVTDGYGSTDTQAFTVIVNNSIYDPTVTLLSQTPSVIYQNSTGYMNISYGITHSASGLNNTSVSFIYRNYDPLSACSNHSIRPPTNNRATEWDLDGRILRAANRNETLNFEDNATITGGNIFDWSGLDENSTRLTIVPVNSTYTLVYVNGTIHDIMPQSWYLDRSDLQEAPKTLMGIHKSQNLLIKSWNIEIFKGNYDHITAGYTDTALESNPALHPSDANPLNYYYVNDSYDPSTDGDPLTSGYAVYMGSGNASEWIDHVYSPHANSSYVRAFINNTILNQYINTTEISYLYLTSNTPSSKPYYINVTDVASSTNVSFADTNVLWAGDATLTQQSYTPNTWLSFMKEDITFDHKLYVADNNDVWSNSTLSSTVVGAGLFPPTKPTFYSFHNGYVDYDMNGTYYGTIQVQIGVSSDPDGGNVTHNMTSHYGNGTLIEVINNASYPANGVFTNISFDTTSYSTLENYTLKVVATDDEGETATTWLGVNFTINYDNFSFSNAAISPSAIRENEPFTVSIDINDTDGTIANAIVKINGGNYSMVNTVGDTWAYVFTGTSVPTRYEIDNFYAQDNLGAWNSTISTLYIDALPSTGTGSSGGISPRIIPEIIPEPIVNVTEEIIIKPLANISEIIERLVSEDVIKIVKFNFDFNSQIFEKEIYIENATRCEFTSDVIIACDVDDDIVTVKFKYEPDGMIYTHSDSITLYADGYSEYREVDIYVVNFADPVWWIMLIVIVGAVVLYRRNKK